jgi:hypothetical protein
MGILVASTNKIEHHDIARWKALFEGNTQVICPITTGIK